MKLSRRVEAIQPSATFAIKAAAASLRAEGHDVVDLSAGEPDGQPPKEAVVYARAALDAGAHRYAPVAGLPELRAAIADSYRSRHGLDVGPANVLVTFGGKQALHSLTQALFESGDEVIIFSPYWVSYLPQLELAHATTVVVRTEPADGFQPDPEAVAAAITPATRAIILNSPSNPTGCVIDRDRLEAIMELARIHDLSVISDEIYDAVTYDGAQATCVPTLSEDAAKRTIIVNAVSKQFAMTGWRVGWLVGAEHVIKACGKLQGHSTSGVCRINQAAALGALSADPAYLEPIRRALVHRRDLAVEALNAIDGVEVGPVPSGAFYLFPRVDGLFGKTSPAGRQLHSAISVADFLIHEGGVAVVPGEAFGEARCIRISYALGREALVSGLERIAAAVATLS